MTRSRVGLLLAATVAAAAVCTPCVLAEPPAETPKADPAAAPAATDAPAADAAKPIPVPDLPVVKKTELEGGLIVEDLKIGEGYEVKPGGAVVAFYHGTLKADGKKFDSAYDRGEPAAFPLTGVIPGWQKGVPGMKVGGIRRLTIPAALGYGEQGAGADIPPNSDLVFVIEVKDAVEVEDVTVGDGEEVGPQPVCVTAYKITDSSGKEVESASREKPFVWFPREHMGISMGLEGMKVGGKRKIKLPKEFNQTDPRAPGVPTGRVNDAPVTVEVELISVRNIVPPTPKAP